MTKKKYLELISKTKAALIEIEAKYLLSGEFVTINDILKQNYSIDDQVFEFLTHDEWSKKGFIIKKGSVSYKLWGRKGVIHVFSESQVKKKAV